MLATKATCSPIQPAGVDGARHGAVFLDKEELDSVLILKILMLPSTLSHNGNGLVSLNLSVDGSSRAQTLLVEIFTLTPTRLRNTAGGQECSHIWGTL